MRRGTRGLLALALAVLLVAVACSEETGSDTDDQTESPADEASVTTVEGDGTVVSKFAGEAWAFGTVPETGTPADDSAEPIKIGMINTEETPALSFPELRHAAEAAVNFINEELGGVDGRPIELEPCIVDLAPETNIECARQLVASGVVAVLGGISLQLSPAIRILEENGIPYVGGIPVNFDEMQSDISFQFSGGSPGAFVAFADHAANDLGAESVAIVYGDLEQVKSAALDYGAETLRHFGVEDIAEVPFPFVTLDYATPIAKAADSDPDAILVGAADTACVPVMEAVDDLGLDAAVYMVGSCADGRYVDEVGADQIAGTMFNVENRVGAPPEEGVDNDLYEVVTETYANDPYNSRSAGTVGFRSMMNLWHVMNDIAPDVTAGRIIETLRAAVARPSFNGHPYTCDSEQVPELPSLCAPQQVLIEITGPGTFEEVSDGWIDVAAILAEQD